MKQALLGGNVKNSACTHVARCILTICLCLGLLCHAGWSQVGAASLSGVVEDPTRAIIPGATVVLLNNASKAERSLHSNAAGAFTFAAVPSGDYTLTVQLTGFQKLLHPGIHLNPGDSLSLSDLTMVVCDVSQTVSVETNVAGLPLDSGQLSSTITTADLDQLSVVGRDATELEKILPGFAIRATVGGGGGASQNSAPDFTQVQVGQPTPYASNGAPVAGLTLKLDGANLTDAGNFGANLQNINDSFVSEVQVQTSNFGADQSNGPVVIQAVTKSGTDKYHGSLYTFARTYQLNANDWLSKADGIARPNEYFVYPGGTISGHIPGTKKLTFFAGAEEDAQRRVYAYGGAGSAIIHALVPTAAMRAGDFSQGSINNYLGPFAFGSGVPQASPAYGVGTYGTLNTAPTVGDNNSTLANGNIAAFLNPGAMALVNGTLPLPTRATGTDGFNYDNLNLVNNNVSQFVGRIDYAISPRNLLFARYSFEKQRQGQPQVPYYSPTGSSLMGAVNTPGYGVDNDVQVHSASANYVTIFTPTLTNELYATLTYFVESFDARQIAALQKSAINYPYNGAFDNNDTQYPQLGTYAVYGGLPLGLWPDYSLNPLQLQKLQPNIGDNLTKVWGKHTVKIGVFSQRTKNNQTATNPQTNGVIQNYYFGGAGSYFADYNGTYPDGSPAYGNPHFNSGNALANFFEGQIQDWHQQNYNPYTNLYFWNTDAYVQDTWHLASNLVVTLGARVSKMTAWEDKHNIGAAIFNAALVTSTANSTTNPIPGLTWHGANASIPNAGVSAPPVYFEPRVGFSLDVFKNGRTVMRGGVGIYRFHDAVTDVTNQFQEAEDVRYTDLQGFGDNTLEGVNTLHLNPKTYGNAGGTETFISPPTIYGLDPASNQEPVTNNYSLSVAQQLPGKVILQVSYVGNNSNDLMDNGTTQTVVLDDVNAIPIGTLFTATAAGKINAKAGYNACNPTGCTPQQAGALDTIYNYPGDKSIQNSRPYPEYNQIIVPEHNTFANYNGLQIEAIKQTGKFTFNANYTFSKALGILGSAADFNYTAGMDPFNIYNNYGPMNFDRTQVLNLSYAYQTGRFTSERLLGGFINGWLISGITNLQSGGNMQTGVSPSPDFYVQGNIGAPGSGTGYAVNNTTILGTPDVSLQPVLTCDPRTGRAAHQYVNGSCFSLPATGTNGQFIFPYSHGPAFFNTDLALEKGFGLGRLGRLRFRYAAFNFLNHPLYSFGTNNASETTLQLNSTSANPSPTTATQPGGSPFGITEQKLGARLSEVSLKFDF